MKIPENAANIISRLEDAGYEAYVVGGCVRDRLLGREPKDWDICTSALPEQVKEVFSGEKIFDTGIRHGTVTLLMDDPVEITTFRLDGEYLDSRRPESVTFTSSIEADLARRDFTVNAMAYSPRTGFIDPFGGRADLNKGIICAVGDPDERFREDALRILRGVRFSVSLDFEIDDNTAAAMLDCRSLLGRISAERVREELTKTLVSGRVKPSFMRFREIIAEIIPELRPAFDFDQHTVHHAFDVYEHILTAVDSYGGSDPAIKTALLLHDIAKPAMCRFYNGSAHFKGHPAAGAKMAEEILRRLKFDNKTRETVEMLIRFHDVRLTGGLPQLLKLLSLVGEEGLAQIFCVMYADQAAQSEYNREEKLALLGRGEENLRLALDRGLCYRLKDLNVSGEDIADLGLKGRKIRAGLNYALNGVMNGKVENEKGPLIKYMAEMAKKWE
ncbi:MAG: CCA tRNA nucleotidyltransferase [Oscillospiraceae bacterium]|nr:CCA tRNA nucleotidyltransferase [Oscillospiraceae bacterium]